LKVNRKSYFVATMKKPPKKPLRDEPGFKRLAELVEGQKIDKARTLEHIDKEANRDERKTNRPV